MYIRATTKRDLELFVPSHEDILEAEAAGHKPEFPDVTECVTLYARLHHSELPLAIGGNVGDRVWFVTSKNVDGLSPSMRREFRKCIMEYRDKMLSKYHTLWNYVWVGNTGHIRFLKSIGAVFHEEYTLNGSFQLFTIRR